MLYFGYFEYFGKEYVEGKALGIKHLYPVNLYIITLTELVIGVFFLII